MRDKAVDSEPLTAAKGAQARDPRAAGRARPRANWDWLITRFRAHAGEEPAERRREPRHPAVEYRAWVGWWRDAHDFVIVAARLENISRGGALLVLADAPPVLDSIWICLGSPDPVDCARGIVLEVRMIHPNGDRAVRVAFRAPCSDVFFRTAILGLGHEAPQEPLTPGREG